MQFQKAVTLYWIALSMLQVLVCLHWLHDYELQTVVLKIEVYNNWKSFYFNNFFLSVLALNFHTIVIHNDFFSVSCYHIIQSSIFIFLLVLITAEFLFLINNQHSEFFSLIFFSNFVSRLLNKFLKLLYFFFSYFFMLCKFRIISELF